ncbi:acetyl-CoA acetyltransferase, cytosolic-like [Planococcus citri]|uniref:acetyl-CoA acetyltransferase, cytosolic-like n=1 Tax=Planococcus citri TaxID=170843 RepID=UPI0031F90839
MSTDIVIVSAARTPIGNFKGCLSELKAHELGAVVIKEVLDRASIAPEDVSEVILGQVLTSGQGQNPARQAALKAGLPNTVPAYGLNILCGSGVQSVGDGYLHILGGISKIVVCGGQESMSQAQHTAYLRPGIKAGDFQLSDTVYKDGLSDAFHNCLMGDTAEYVAEKYNVSREEQDKQALNSQQRAEDAIKSGKFKKEIVPVIIRKGKEEIVVDTDEYPKFGSTLDILRKLKPAYKKDGGTVTAGNASGINDGAAAVVLMQKSEADRRGLSPLAKFVGFTRIGLAPLLMGLSPIQAIQSLLAKIGWSKDEVDIYEINEAYAAHSIVILKELGLNPDKVNIFGGAVALGHPLGASGTRVLVTLLSALEQTGGKKGVAALCIGGGQGIAIAVERY